MDNSKTYLWRIYVAITLTSLGVLYYLVFLYYLCGGIPIERIHYYMTDGWPNFCADFVAMVAPAFLFLGLFFWYSYTLKMRPKAVPEPEYDFHFTTVEKSPDTITNPDYVFENRINKPVKISSLYQQEGNTED